MSARKPLPKGRMAEIFEEVGPAVAEAVDRLLLEGASANEVAGILTDEGYPVSPTTVKARRKELRS